MTEVFNDINGVCKLSINTQLYKIKYNNYYCIHVIL